MKCELTADNKKNCKNKTEPAKCKIFVFFFIVINKLITINEQIQNIAQNKDTL